MFPIVSLARLPLLVPPHCPRAASHRSLLRCASTAVPVFAPRAMSSKSAKKANTQAAAAAPAAAASVSGRKHRAPEPAAAAHSDDDADFHDLPKETQPKKKQKKGSAAAAAHVPVLDPEAAAASAAQAAAAQTKKNAAAAASVAAAAASATRKNGGSKLAKVPVVGGAGADDEDMDSGDERDGSDDEGKAVVKTLTKTQAKEARVWDRPAVSATEILPDLHARTPSHTQITAAPTTTGSAAASAALLQPLAAVPSALTAPISKSNPSTRKVIIVLVKASLETVKTKKGYELISADSHKFVLQKLKKNPSEYRPDILHQCLLTLLDSPLNKAGMLQVFVQTEKVRRKPRVPGQRGSAKSVR